LRLNGSGGCITITKKHNAIGPERSALPSERSAISSANVSMAKENNALASEVLTMIKKHIAFGDFLKTDD
jgi:hypothetical protein